MYKYIYMCVCVCMHIALRYVEMKFTSGVVDWMFNIFPLFLVIVILDHSSEFLGRSWCFSFPPVVASVEFETLVATRSSVCHICITYLHYWPMTI